MDLNSVQNFYHAPQVSSPCYVLNITAEHGVWQSENPLTQALPLLVMQLALVVFLTHALFFLLRPLSMPRFFTDVLGGILLGPTAMSNIKFFALVFPLRSISTVETVAYWGLTCHMFLVGLELDTNSISRTCKKVLNVAIAGVVIPYTVGIALFFILNSSSRDSYRGAGCFFFAAALTVTSFPVVARTLSDLKLLHSETGRMAMSCSAINDLASFMLVATLIPARNGLGTACLAVISTAIFTMFCFYVARPVLAVLIRSTARGNQFHDFYLCSVLVGASIFALVTEIFGANSVAGAFIFGLIMPNRVLAGVLIEKFDDFVSGYMLPLFFVVCGIRINVWEIKNWGMVLLVLLFACSVKILCTLSSSFFYNVPQREGFALGVIMNTKGVLAMVVLNLAFDSGHLQNQDYAVMVVGILLMTGIATPIIAAMYHPAKRVVVSHRGRRTIQTSRADMELKILACFHSFHNVSSIINLVDSSNPTEHSPLFVFALHLVELTGRASAMLIVHAAGKTRSRTRTRRDPHSEQLIAALESYQILQELVTIQPLTALSPFSTMHEDICSLAEDKEVAFIILPFHKLSAHNDGNLDDEENASFRCVNLNVLANAPCTVGVFVDRGFGLANPGESNLKMRHVAVLFIGGPDDREAVAYAWRMSGNQKITLTVIRFLPSEDFEGIKITDPASGDTHRLTSSVSYIDKQRRMDDEYVNEFRLKSAGQEFVSYEEKVVNSDEEMVSALGEMNQTYDLYVVGKGEGVVSPLTAGLLDWCEFPELGAIGDLLVTSSFAQTSVLVMQQYYRSDAAVPVNEEEDSGGDRETATFGNWGVAVAEEGHGVDIGGLEMQPFAKHK